MHFSAITRFFTGWVHFRAEGGLPARLLDETASKGIPLWDVRREGIELYARCPARVYPALRRPARRAGLRLQLIGKHGLPFFLHRFRGRWGLAVGGVLALLLLQFLSGRIWAVTVSGNTHIPEQELRQAATEWGVQVGAPIDALDIEAIRLNALTRVDGVAWLTVNLEGSVAHVELLEADDPVEILDTSRPSNLVAARDGWIVSMEIFGGESVVKTGDAVTAGTLLVSGATIADTQLLLRRSYGTVVARTERELSVTVPLTEELLQPAGSLYRVSLCVFGLDIPLSPAARLPDTYQLTLDDRFFTADGVTLPIGLRHAHYTALTPQTVTRTTEQAQEEAVRRLRALEQAELSAAVILESRYTCRQTADGFELTGHYICEEDIAREQQIFVEK